MIARSLDLYSEGLSARKVKCQIEQFFGFKIIQITTWKWIMKYSRLVSEFLFTLKPQLSGKGHIDETVIKAKGEQKRFWDVVDYETWYPLASYSSGKRTIEELIPRQIKVMK